MRHANVENSISKMVVPILLSKIKFDLIHELISKYRYSIGVQAVVWTQIIEDAKK